jgi:hypothetical protein
MSLDVEVEDDVDVDAEVEVDVDVRGSLMHESMKPQMPSRSTSSDV